MTQAGGGCLHEGLCDIWHLITVYQEELELGLDKRDLVQGNDTCMCYHHVDNANTEAVWESIGILCII